MMGYIPKLNKSFASLSVPSLEMRKVPEPAFYIAAVIFFAFVTISALFGAVALLFVAGL